jgi:ATP-binding cassette subfamily F protein 3
VELIRFSGLERHYGAKEVFSNLSGVVRDGEKIGIVGPNGAGKSTLTRLLAARDEPDGGTIVRAKETRFGYLAQEASESGPATIREAFDEAVERGGAQEWEIRATLNRFGFSEDDLDRPLTQFSGGQRTRALLARTLLEQPDWLLLDEPTNHLDIDTVRWLESFVARDNRAYIIVSHDRYFLETVASTIWELDRGVLATYEVKAGRAYSMFLEERDARREQARREYEASVSEFKRQRAVVDELKTHGSHNYSAVRSREKALDRVSVSDAPAKERRRISIALDAARSATKGYALEISGISKSYDKPLFSDLTANFVRGERVAIVGPNGAGKTTLLRILNGEANPDRGSIRYGTGLTMASYSQSSVDDLPAKATAVEAVMAMGANSETARSLLGRLNLGGDATDKPVEAFSGGERRRIMLARLMAQRADCLFLDEPTNDLDIASREALEDVLFDYGGAMFIVSHDRFLLKRLAQRVIAVRDGQATVIDGDYETYEQRAHAAVSATNGSKNKGKAKAEAPKAKPPEPPSRYAAHEAKLEAGRRKRAVADAERRVADLDAERAEIELRFTAAEIYENPETVVGLQRELDAVKSKVEAAYAAWEAAIDALETEEATATE